MKTSNNELCIVSTKIRHTQHAHTCLNSALSSALHTADMIKSPKKMFLCSRSVPHSTLYTYTHRKYTFVDISHLSRDQAKFISTSSSLYTHRDLQYSRNRYSIQSVQSVRGIMISDSELVRFSF